MAELTHLAKNKQNITELHCSAEFTAEVHDEIIVLSVLNIFLSITAFLGNTLILAALRKEKSLHSPSKLLYRNLAVTDLCVGIIVEPLFITYLMSLKTGRWDICYHVFAVAGFAGYIALYLVRSVFVGIDCNKPGQTSCPVVRAEIQTSCNFEKSLYICILYVGIVHCWLVKHFLESLYIYTVSLHTSVILFTHNNFLLHKNFFHSPSSPNSSPSGPGSSSTTGSSNSTEHSSIQKGGVQCTMGAGNIGCLLSAVCRSSLDAL